MAERKKQVSIAAFFSPKPTRKRPAAADKPDDAASPPVQAPAAVEGIKSGKRPRTSPASATAAPTVTPPVGKPKADKTGNGSDAKATVTTGKRTTAGAAGKQQRQKQQKQQKPREPKTRAKGKVLFTSPHELGDEDKEMEDDVEVATGVKSGPVEEEKEESHAVGEQVVEIEMTAVKATEATGSEVKKTAEKEEMAVVETGEPDPVVEHTIDLTASPVRPKRTAAATSRAVQDVTQTAVVSNGNAAVAGVKKRRGRPRKSAVKPLAAGKPQTKSVEGGAKSAKTTVEATTAPEIKVALDPAVQARVDTYQLKLRDLTQSCAALLVPSDVKPAADAADGAESAHDAQRALLQDVYGVGLDFQLAVSTDEQEMTAAVTDLWSKWRAQAAEDSTTTVGGASDLAHPVRALIAKHIQGRGATLSSLCEELMATLRSIGGSDNSQGDDAVDRQVVARAALAVEMEIKMLAQRTPYGTKPPPRANLFEDTTPEALWVWEVGNPERFYKDEEHKTLKRLRKHRKRVGQQLKSLARVVHLLHQSPVDEAKVSAEEAKVGKFVTGVEAELSKARDRERKEMEKAQAVEDKRRADEDKKLAKEGEKKLKEEAERELAAKRRKSLVSYFRSIDTELAPSATVTTTAVGAVVIDLSASSAPSTGVEATGQGGSQLIEVENSSETIARMDQAITFLHGDGDAIRTSSTDLKLPWKPAGGSRVVARGSTHSWTSKRRRDAKRGVLKLLQFHENHRPAFYGTFSDKTRVFRGGRRPLALVKTFDYSVDSDDEWEEEEPGESLSDADSDNDESDDDNLDYGDNWLAYEDEVEYMDGEDGEDEDEDVRSADDNDSGSPTKHRKRKLPSQLEQKRRKKLAKLTRLEPKVIGPLWCLERECGGHFSGMEGQMLVGITAVKFESPLMRRAREFEQMEAERQRKKQEEMARKAQQAADKAAEDKGAKIKAATPVKVKPTAQAPVKSKSVTPVKPRKAAAISAVVATSPAPTAAAATPVPSPPQQPGITAFFQPQTKSASAVPVVTGPGATALDAVVVDEEDGDVEMVPVDEK